MVYFIQVMNGGPIKVGFAVNPEKRFKAIQGCNHEKLEIIAVIPGVHSLENKIHKDLRGYNIHGEWFRPDKEVIEYIKNIQVVEYEKEGEQSWAVLRRDTENSKTGYCPFCGKRHIHGLGDGHRVAHCISGNNEAYAKDGTVLYKERGYIIRTRFKENNV